RRCFSTVRASWWTSSPAPGNSGPRVTPVKPGGERSVKGKAQQGRGRGTERRRSLDTGGAVRETTSGTF
ncbi:unnamed protein product, partial [Ectocarpus fasciculatus]